MYHVIIIEDDPMVASINKQYIEVSTNFRVEHLFKNGAEALPYIKTKPVDLVILDYYTPVMNGGEFLDALHAAGLTPYVIMVTSANDTDIVRSLLNRGVTDYLVKPFGMMEMVSRIKAVLRRCMPKKENKTVYVNGIIEMNVEEHTVSVSGESICLTYKEYEILKIFLMHPGMAYTRNRLLSEVWGIDSYGESRTVDMHIKTLRQKLGDGGRYIVTVRNVGYKMEVHND